MKILFIQTGGTIDKDYPHTTKGWAFEITDPASKRILDFLNPSFEYNVITACRKDSLELNNTDREIIAKLIEDNKADGYVITHGTDTMVETGEYLDKLISKKKVVITGAMLPQRFSNSDAPINLGLAIGALSSLDDGVYVAMHGIVKLWSKVKRDLNSGKYY